MSTLEAMSNAIGTPAFQGETMAYYRRVVMDMMRDPANRSQRADLFGALRAITDWQRADTDDFQRFYDDYCAVMRIIDRVNEALECAPELRRRGPVGSV